MDELLKHLDNWEVVLYISLACIVLTVVVNLIFGKYRFVKYIPGMIFIFVGLFNFFSVLDSLTEAESINNLSLFILLVVGGIIGLLSALIIGIYNKPIKKKKGIKADKD
jgi:predicted neutral ceramidase superfamily lipid hydrolase